MAILEIVDALDAHERILYAAKIDPDMRELVREQRPSVKIFISVTAFPSVRRSPRGVAAHGQRMSGRAQAQNIQEHRLIVAFPTVFEKSTFGLPTVCNRRTTVLCPLPIRAVIERIGEGTDFVLVGFIGVKVNSRSQRTRQQKSAIYR